MKKIIKKLFRKVSPEKPLEKQGTKKVRVGDYELTANESHLIEVHLLEYPHYSRNLPRLIKYLVEKYPKLSVIDVGANIGDSVALIRSSQVPNPIYCFEGEPTFLKLLRENLQQFSNVQVIDCFLGEETTTLKVSLGATADSQSLQWNENAIGIKIMTLDDIAENENFEKTKVLKIDTDGFDLKIIRGALGFIKKSKPMIFFEYDHILFKKNEENALTTLAALEKLGYSKILYYDNFGKFLLSTDLKNVQQLSQLDNYINGLNNSFNYYDVCIFHEFDNDIALKILRMEKEFFQRV